mgnify:CR=1 FL=1
MGRIGVIEAVKQKQITQCAASLKLGVSDRQIRNLLRSFLIEGEKALISKKRGKKGNHSKSATLKSEVLTLIQNHYSDFGPKLAAEYLKKNQNIEISDETLRLWMINWHIWIPRKQTPFQARSASIDDSQGSRFAPTLGYYCCIAAAMKNL